MKLQPFSPTLAKGQRAFLRAAPGDFEKADQGTHPGERNGQPCAYLWKDAIEAKRYVSKKKNLELHVTQDRMDGWLRAFTMMKARGVPVPVCLDHSDSARDCVGYIIDMQKRGEKLYLLHQFIGDDAAKLAARNYVSLGIEPEYEDGEGRKYGEAIIHSALTPVPVVPGQGGFSPSIAASRGGQSVEGIVFELAASNEQENAMTLTPEQVKAIRDIGAGGDVTDDGLLDWLIKHTEAGKGAQAALLSRATVAEARVKEIEPKLTAAQQQVVTLSNATPKAVDPEVLHERSLRVNDRIAGLSLLTPDDQKKLREIVNGAHKPVMLSRNGDDADCLAAQIVDFLSGVKPAPATGGRTGIQTLSRQLPKDDPTKADDEASAQAAYDQAAAYAKGQNPKK